MKRNRKCITLLLCVILLCSGITVHAENEQVKISDKEYLLTLDNKANVFIGNSNPVNGEVGSKVFLTYTVEKVTQKTATQCGVVAALNRTDPWPYTTGGGMYFAGTPTLFDEGYTYVIRMERTAEGFEYQCVKLKEDEGDYIKFNSFIGEKVGDFQYYGIWIGGAAGTGISAVLTHVRCYDEKGNDLGIAPSNLVNQAHANEELLDVHLTVGHSYDFSIKNGFNVAISNKKAVKDSNAVVYMEYEVEEVTKDETAQYGLILSDSPTELYPHLNGRMQWQGNSGTNPLLQKGAKYFICFSKEKDDFKGVVQCTLKGETSTFVFGGKNGTYDASYGYYSLWIAEGGRMDCVIKNFKCYDAKGNNLGVQFNDTNIKADHKGELEDYSEVEEVYFCEENGKLLVLEDDKKAYVETDGVREEATYKIIDEVLILSFLEGKEQWTCDYIIFTDEDGNQYKRLKEMKVTFVTGEETFVQKANKENGYRVDEPEEPSKKDNEFLGWCLGDGTEYDFNSVVSESITLYAKWRDGNGVEYLAADESIESNVDMKLWISIGASVVLLAIFMAGCVWIRRRYKACC